MKTKTYIATALVLALPGLSIAQICADAVSATAPMHRFDVHDDGTATDTSSGLRWQRCPVSYGFDDNGTPSVLSDDGCVPDGTTTFNWQGALQSADAVNQNGGFAGFTDWRVPSVKELASIVEFKCAAPAINTTLFPDTPARLFWSSTTTNIIGSALVIDFHDGRNFSTGMNTAGQEYPVRLVRF